MRVLPTGFLWSLLSYALVFAMPLNAQSTATNRTDRTDRSVQFPADRSLGILYVAPSETAENERFDWLSPEFKKLGFAQGSVSLPDNTIVRLDVAAGACSDLSPFSDIPPETIQILFFNVRSDPTGQFDYIGALTGLTHLIFRGCPLNDDGIMELKRLENLESLSLDFTDVSESGLSYLAGMDKLKNLSFQQLGTDDGLGVYAAECLSQVPNLERVVGKWNLTEVGFEHLAKLKRLESLSNLTKLKHLNIENTNQLRFEFFDAVSKLKQLESLSIDGADASDDDYRKLSRLTKLQYLDIFSQITNEQLLYLADLPSLIMVQTNSKNLTLEGINHFKGKSKSLQSFLHPLTRD